LDLSLSELSQNSQHLISNGLNNPGFFSLILIFFGGLITSLGPCSLSLLPVTIAYLAGFQDKQSPFFRSISFCSGIILSLVILGLISSLLGNIFGQLPFLFPKIIALLAIVMGLNLLGLIKIKLPIGPNPDNWRNKVPKIIAPCAAGVAFGLAASPCTTPVLAVLLAWISQNANPLTGVVILAVFGTGQVMPLIITGTAAATIPNLLKLRPIGQFIPTISGTIFIIIGSLNLLSELI
tara:strand:+ start:18131 stop:18841 length:711 start_codon:yes stop_codon:yes gene_type:complete